MKIKLLLISFCICNRIIVRIVEIMNISVDINSKWINQSKKIKEILKSNDDFNDPYFGAEHLTWLRPKSFIKSPELGIDSLDCSQIRQGTLDDCGLISVCCTIAKYSYLINNIFKEYNSIKGFVELKFYLNNEWVSIYIDDKLPSENDELSPKCSTCLNKKYLWLTFIEKAFAKIYDGYENLAGIDGAYAMVVLTGGMVLRLNPNYLNDREAILHYLNESKAKNFLVGIAGCELTTKNQEIKNELPRVGHAYALADVIHITNKNKAFIKMYNCQRGLKIKKENNELDLKLLESLSININEAESIVYFSFEEFFSYFEIFNILVVFKNVLKIGNEISLRREWTRTSKNHLIEKYLKSPLFVFEIKNKDPLKMLIIVLNIQADEINSSDFKGVFYRPIRNRKNEYLFVDFNLQPQPVINTNPLTQEIKLLPGKYLFGLLIESNLAKKLVNFRIACMSSSSRIEHLEKILFSFKLVHKENEKYLFLNELKVKLIIAKCCVCDCFLDADIIQSGAKVYCTECYNISFRCAKCDIQVGQEYFTFEQRLFCSNCINKYNQFIHKTDFLTTH